jgi:hypothetical protein
VTWSTGATTYGHVCWSFDDPAGFDARARDFLTGGLAAGEQVWYVSPEHPDVSIARLQDLDGFPEALHRGAAKIVALDAAYASGRVIDPRAQVRAYTAATDATSLVRTSAQLEAFTRYEHLIDRYMRTRPMTALCAYDRVALGDAAIAQLACMHPETNADDVLFRLHAADPGEGCAALAGELDITNHELFATALDRAELSPVGGELVLQAADLRFIDHRSLFRLQELARRSEATVVLRTTDSAAALLVELLELSEVRVEAVR